MVDSEGCLFGVVPRGDTRVEPGDVLVLLTARSYERELREWVTRREEG